VFQQQTKKLSNKSFLQTIQQSYKIIDGSIIDL